MNELMILFKFLYIFNEDIKKLNIFHHTILKKSININEFKLKAVTLTQNSKSLPITSSQINVVNI